MNDTDTVTEATSGNETDAQEARPITEGKAKPPWQPLSPIDRRVLGVLVEKAKTTPDAYPLSLNALCTGCNQKNNRDPVTQLTAPEVEESLVRLREFGAVEEVQGSGRVPRFRHHLYDWLGVDKTELAVMAELLLRGAQTEGELRGRAARMEPIADVAALRPILNSLKQKGLIIALTGEGRGHVVSHNLHPAGELESLRANFASLESRPPREPSSGSSRTNTMDAVRNELNETRAEVAQLRQELDNLKSRVDQLARMK